MIAARKIDRAGELDHLRICLHLAEERCDAPESLARMRAEIVERERSVAYALRRMD